MATVFLAEDLRHERKVALKVLKPELAAVVGAERFLAEIKTTANLQHPHILPLHDARSGAQGGGMVMAARLQRDPVPVVLSTDSLFSGGYGQPFSGSPLHPDGDRFIFTQSVASAESADSAPLRLLMVTNFFEELRLMVPD
jgi:serine/threonine protein kinase